MTYVSSTLGESKSPGTIVIHVLRDGRMHSDSVDLARMALDAW